MTEGKNLLRHSLQKNKTKNLCFYPQKKIQSTTTEAIGPQKKNTQSITTIRKETTPLMKLKYSQKTNNNNSLRQKRLKFWGLQRDKLF